ncbi:hypothetical protein, partial [Isoptericola haloaureus]
MSKGRSDAAIPAVPQTNGDARAALSLVRADRYNVWAHASGWAAKYTENALNFVGDAGAANGFTKHQDVDA